VPRLRDANGFRLRAAGICVRNNNDETEILLVTSRTNHNVWVLPGGGVELDESPQQAAIREVYEEAGVICEVIRHVALFVDELRRNKTDTYVLRVDKELDDWEELHRIGRQRRWFNRCDATAALKQWQRHYLDAIHIGLADSTSSGVVVVLHDCGCVTHRIETDTNVQLQSSCCAHSNTCPPQFALKC